MPPTGSAAPDAPEESGGTTLTPEPPATLPPAPDAPSVPTSPPDTGSSDPLNSRATWEDEGHFVPPVPPPLPSVEPRRRIAWIALLGSPVVGLLLVLLQIAIPRWMSSLLVIAFVGGFCYLVATMGQPSRGDWSGDDGAVL